MEQRATLLLATMACALIEEVERSFGAHSTVFLIGRPIKVMNCRAWLS